MTKKNLNILAYLLLAVGLSVGVWAMTERAEDEIVDNINKTVSALCIDSIPRVKAENALRDVQIQVVTQTKKLNLADGDTARAAVNDTYIKALKQAKRHVPTVEECSQELIE